MSAKSLFTPGLSVKQIHRSLMVLILSASVLSKTLAGVSDERSRIWEGYASYAYTNLNARLNGALIPLFRSIGDFGELNQYFDKDRNPEKYEAYRQFLVQALADAMKGDVAEAMFADVVVEFTPTRVLLPMIAPEIGPQGKLRGILDGKSNAVAKKLERRSQVIYEGSVNFDDYVSHLKGGKDRGYTAQTNADVIVEHMFKTEPQKAFIAMLWADYGFLPYAKGNCYLSCGKDTDEVRSLQQMQQDIKDYLLRLQYSFPVEKGKEQKVKEHLKVLSQHEKPWVRLYLVCLMEKDRNLRFRGIIDSLAEDSDEAVRSAVARINKEYPSYWKD